MECRLQMLQCSGEGYIAWCDRCGHFQLGFGTFQLCMTESELRAFDRLIRQDVGQGRDRVCQEVRQFTYKTAAPGLHIVFTWRELGRFSDLLQAGLACSPSRQERLARLN